MSNIVLLLGLCCAGCCLVHGVFWHLKTLSDSGNAVGLRRTGGLAGLRAWLLVRAAVWHGYWSLCYADTNTSTAYEESYRMDLHNPNKVSNRLAFERTYEPLMSSLVARAVNGSSSEPVPLFATGHAVYDHAAPTTNGTMYGLVQCMRDRTAAECRQCLKHSVAEAPKCCYGYQGKVVLGYNCYVRVEIYTYYDPALDTPPTPRPLAGKGKLFLNYFYVSPGF
jgi:hypothetical protein